MTGKKFLIRQKYDVTISRYFFELVHVPYLKNDTIFLSGLSGVLCTVFLSTFQKKANTVFFIAITSKKKNVKNNG